MSELLRRVQTLVLSGDVEVSEHGYEELRKDDILIEDIMTGVAAAMLVEQYSDRSRGPSVLTLQHDASGQAIHVVWALPAGKRRPAVLVTAYRPDPSRWDDDSRKRKRR